MRVEFWRHWHEMPSTDGELPRIFATIIRVTTTVVQQLYDSCTSLTHYHIKNYRLDATKHNEYGRRRTDIHPTQTPWTGYRSYVGPSSCVCWDAFHWDATT